MKKFIALLTMITCLLGLTACGGGKGLTDYEQQKLEAAVGVATDQVIPSIQRLISDPYSVEVLHEYTAEEIETVIGQMFNMDVDGNAYLSALDSFAATYEEMGGYGTVTDTLAEIDGKRIIVNVSIEGPKANAKAEIILSNDFFFALESAALNKEATMGDLMGKAALNTLLGMGTVFIVLVLISLIISCFNLIPKVQASFARKKENVRTEGIDNAVAQITVQEESKDDLELVAVIAAAIAASEGAASTDGFVVRSIRRRRVFN